MTESAPRRDTVSCHECGALLGTLNLYNAVAAKRGTSYRIMTVERTEDRDVRIFVDLTMRRAEMLCPACGQIGRTLRGDRIRGIILNSGDAC